MRLLHSLFILMIFSTVANAQYIQDDELGRIDIRELPDKFISMGGFNRVLRSRTITTSIGELKLFGTNKFKSKFKTKYNVYDGSQVINAGQYQQMLNWLDKYGYEFYQDMTKQRTVNNYYNKTSQTITDYNYTFRKKD